VAGERLELRRRQRGQYPLHRADQRDCPDGNVTETWTVTGSGLTRDARVWCAIRLPGHHGGHCSPLSRDHLCDADSRWWKCS
jgi:hypothetical protein